MSQQELENLNRMAVQIRFYEEQLQQMQQQMQLLQGTLMNLEGVNFTIENLENVETEQEILLPVGNVARIRTKILDPKNIILNVGANVFIEKPTKDAVENVNKKIEDVKKAQEMIQKNMEQIMQQMEVLRPKFSELYQRLQPKPGP